MGSRLRPTGATPLEPDAELHIDREAARLLADWYQFGAQRTQIHP
ncbi:MAG TPA: hypothetical protein VIY28_07370 [Pseudonocardiaceae bacterium]